MMNGNLFGLFGYLSVLLWVCVPLLWLVNRIKGGTRWLCTAALLVAFASLLFARINSETHVDRIEPDRTEQLAEVQAREEAKRKAAEESRSEDVADIRFAEDGSGDFLDKAGMDEADLKYMESVNSSDEPEWKKEKKNRSDGGNGDGDVDSMVGGDKAISGVESDSLSEEDAPEPIIMKESDMVLARRLDGMNKSAIHFMILAAMLMCAVDYLRRANRYELASHPLPLPSFWLNSLTPLPPVVSRPASPRRDVVSELAWLAKRGDAFLYVTDDNAKAAAIPASMPRIGRNRLPIDVIHVTENDALITDEFVFESLWYGRSCFVIGSVHRAEQLMETFLRLMEERKGRRAQTSQSAHVVWDARKSLPATQAGAFERLAKATGFSLFLCHSEGSENPS